MANRATMRQRAARMAGELVHKGTATGGTTAYIEDTALPVTFTVPPGAYANLTIATVENERAVVAFDDTNKYINVSPVLSGAPTNEAYEILRQPKEVYDDLINDAIRQTQWKVMADVTDETLVVVGGTFEYSVPAGLNALYELWVEDDVSTGDYNYRLPDKWWWTLSSGEIYLNETVQNWEGRTIRIIGQANYDELSDDTTSTDLDQDYIQWYVVWQLLMSQEASQTQLGRIASIDRYGNYALTRLREVSTGLRPGSALVRS